MTKQTFLLTFLCVSFIFIGCEKEVSPAIVGSTEVSIVFNSPTHNQTLNGSSEVSIEARIDANELMSGYRVIITDKKNGDVLDTIDDLYEQTQYIVHHHWYPSINEPTVVEIKIEALERNLLVLEEGVIDVTCTP